MMQRQVQAGFTLIEVIIVLMILGMVASLVLVRQPIQSAALEAETTTRALMGTLQLARSTAIAQNRAVSVLITERGFSIEGGRSLHLPASVSLTPMRVVFESDGGSTGGTILLTAGAHQLAVSVSWLTGLVQVRELQGGRGAIFGVR